MENKTPWAMLSVYPKKYEPTLIMSHGLGKCVYTGVRYGDHTGHYICYLIRFRYILFLAIILSTQIWNWIRDHASNKTLSNGYFKLENTSKSQYQSLSWNIRPGFYFPDFPVYQKHVKFNANVITQTDCFMATTHQPQTYTTSSAYFPDYTLGTISLLF